MDQIDKPLVVLKITDVVGVVRHFLVVRAEAKHADDQREVLADRDRKVIRHSAEVLEGVVDVAMASGPWSRKANGSPPQAEQYVILLDRRVRRQEMGGPSEPVVDHRQAFPAFNDLGIQQFVCKTLFVTWVGRAGFVTGLEVTKSLDSPDVAQDRCQRWCGRRCIGESNSRRCPAGRPARGCWPRGPAADFATM